MTAASTRRASHLPRQSGASAARSVPAGAFSFRSIASIATVCSILALSAVYHLTFSSSIENVTANGTGCVNCLPLLTELNDNHGTQATPAAKAYKLAIDVSPMNIAPGAPVRIQIQANTLGQAFGGLALGAYDATNAIVGQWTELGQAGLPSGKFKYMTSGKNCKANTYGMLSHTGGGGKPDRTTFHFHIPTSVVAGSTITIRAVVQEVGEITHYSFPATMTLTVQAPVGNAATSLPITQAQVPVSTGSTGDTTGGAAVTTSSCVPAGPSPGGAVTGPFLGASCLAVRTYADKTNKAIKMVMTGAGVANQYMAFGLATSLHDMSKALYWMGWVDSAGKAHCAQYLSADNVQPKFDTSVTLTAVAAESGIANGVTTVSCVKSTYNVAAANGLVLAETDKQLVHWALGLKSCGLLDNSQCGSHGGSDQSGAITANLFAGGGTPPPPSFFDQLNPGYLLCILLAGVMLSYALISNVYTLTKCGQQSQADREIQQWERQHNLQPGAPLTAAHAGRGAPGALNDQSGAAQRWNAQWQRLMTEDGYAYFYNASTFETAWNVPPMPDYFAKQNGGGGGGGQSDFTKISVDSNGRALPTANMAAIASPLRAKEASLLTKVESVLEYRLPFSQWSIKEVTGIMGYLLLNGLCLLYGIKTETLANQLGYLAGANALIVVIPSTRNSLLVWLFGLPFDRVVVFHRFLGRLLMIIAALHFFAYISQWRNANLDAMSEMWKGEGDKKGVSNVSGSVALLFLFLINVTAIGWIRRRHFNIFYYSHFFFIAFYVALVFHHPQMKYYCLMVVILYGIDRVIRMFWSLIPYQTTLLVAKGADIIQLQFPKHCLANVLGMYKVGQYVFINFPGLGFKQILEWHPYSISSGPDEITTEIHIRGLGDHTRLLRQHVVTTGGLPMTVRIDGPYGNHRLNYRRYPVLVLIAGGIGITPIVSICKDIYRVGNLAGRVGKGHSIEAIYVIWVIPEEAVYEWFVKEFDECWRESQKPQMPLLSMWIYVTRGSADGHRVNSAIPPENFQYGKPDFDQISEVAVMQNPGKSQVAFACGPTPMVNAVWDACVQQKRSGRRVDFHHEVFDW